MDKDELIDLLSKCKDIILEYENHYSNDPPEHITYVLNKIDNITCKENQ